MFSVISPLSESMNDGVAQIVSPQRRKRGSSAWATRERTASAGRTPAHVGRRRLRARRALHAIRTTLALPFVVLKATWSEMTRHLLETAMTRAVRSYSPPVSASPAPWCDLSPYTWRPMALQPSRPSESDPQCSPRAARPTSPFHSRFSGLLLHRQAIENAVHQARGVHCVMHWSVLNCRHGLVAPRKCRRSRPSNAVIHSFPAPLRGTVGTTSSAGAPSQQKSRQPAFLELPSQEAVVQMNLWLRCSLLHLLCSARPVCSSGLDTQGGSRARILETVGRSVGFLSWTFLLPSSSSSSSSFCISTSRLDRVDKHVSCKSSTVVIIPA